MKERLEHPPTPEASDDDDGEGDSEADERKQLNEYLEDEGADREGIATKLLDMAALTPTKIGASLKFIDPRGMFHLFWLGLISAVFLYNAWVIPLRFFFPLMQVTCCLLIAHSTL